MSRATNLSATLALLVGVLLAALAVAATPAKAGPPAGFTTETLVSGLNNPTAFAYAPDGRVFIAEDAGRVKVYSAEGQYLALFMDLRAEVNHYGDRGLIGIALDPNFANNRRVYLNFTEQLGGNPDSTAPAGGKLIRVAAQAGNPNVADLSTRTTLVSGFTSDHYSHSVGALRFDTTGMLIAAYGDGASYTQVDPLAFDVQDLDDVNGKYIRINPNTGNGVPGNPYYNASQPGSIRSKVIARGLRNPFRFTVDDVSGDIWLGDVGWGQREEIHRIPKPGTITNPNVNVNFGWPCREGDVAQGQYIAQYPSQCAAITTANTAAPVHAWRESGGGAAVGGPIWRGSVYPSTWNGRLFFADYAKDVFYTRTPGGAVAKFGTNGGWGAPVDIQTGPDGRIHYMSWGDDSLKRIIHSSNPPANDINPTDDIVNGSFEQPSVVTPGWRHLSSGQVPGWSSPDVVEVWHESHVDFPATPNGVQAAELNTNTTGLGRIHQDLNTTPGDTLTIRFLHRGRLGTDSLQVRVGPPSATASVGNFSAGNTAWKNQTATYVVPAGQTVTRIEFASLSAPSNFGNHIDNVRVTATPPVNTPPVAQVNSPSTSFRYNVGQTINISLAGSDAEDGALPPAALAWEITQIHLAHEHPITSGTGATTNFTATDHGDDSYYVVDLTVTDSAGATDTVRREIRPRTAPVTITTAPVGIGVAYDTGTVATPIAVDSIVGGAHTAVAPATASIGAQTYTFAGWSGGGTVANRQVNWTVAPGGLNLVANYDLVIPNRPPVANASASPLNGTAPLAVSFSGAGSTDPDGDSLSYSWDFTSDGTADATGVSASHNYLVAGTYIATLTVSDGNGEQDTDTLSISVSPPAGPIAWEYFHGTWDELPNFDALTPVSSGAGNGFSLSPRTREDNYGFRFRSCLTAPASGVYTFSTTSDDGSALRLGGLAVVDNDGLHGPVTASGQIALTAGQSYPLEATFFEKSGGALLEVVWSGPGVSGAIPASVLSPAAGCVSGPPPAAPVAWEYFHGAWSQLPNFDTLTPVSTGSSTGFSLAPRTRGDNYGFRFSACLTAPASGTYSFTTISDDGSALSIGGLEVVNNDGLHGAASASGQISLSAGQAYPLEVVFFERSGDAVLDVAWSGPGAASGPIPVTALSAPGNCTGTPPPSTPIAWEYFHGSWDQLPNFDALTPVSSGTAPSFSLAPRTRDDNYAFRFRACITAPTSGTWTFGTTSDDGSALSVGGIAVVNNDGLHSAVSASGQIDLTAGQAYPLEVTFFEKSGDAILDVAWSGPGTPASPIPVSALAAPGTCAGGPPPTAPIAWDYYHGSWDLLPAFSSLTPVASGNGTGFSLAPRTRDDDYAFRFRACLTAPASGTWAFATTSDDGSALKIGATTVVDNDGLHAAQSATGQIAMVAGTAYPLEVTFFEKSGDAILDVAWTGPGNPAAPIPLSALSAPGSC